MDKIICHEGTSKRAPNSSCGAPLASYSIHGVPPGKESYPSEVKPTCCLGDWDLATRMRLAVPKEKSG